MNCYYLPFNCYCVDLHGLPVQRFCFSHIRDTSVKNADLNLVPYLHVGQKLLEKQSIVPDNSSKESFVQNIPVQRQLDGLFLTNLLRLSMSIPLKPEPWHVKINKPALPPRAN